MACPYELLQEKSGQEEEIQDTSSPHGSLLFDDICCKYMDRFHTLLFLCVYSCTLTCGITFGHVMSFTYNFHFVMYCFSVSSHPYHLGELRSLA